MPLVAALVVETLPGSGVLAAADPTFAVNSPADTHARRPGDGRCADAAGRCTLRAALEVANAARANTGFVINVPAGTYTLSLGELDIAPANPPVTVTIRGQGVTPSDTVIQSQAPPLPTSRVLGVSANGNAAIENVSLSGGNAGVGAAGGGIANIGTLSLSRSKVSGNQAGLGGGIANIGSLTLTKTEVTGNTATSHGGGILNDGRGILLLNGTNVLGNAAATDGGGVYNSASGTVRLKLGTTVGFNVARSGNGGGIYTAGAQLSLTSNSRVLANRANQGDGGGIYVAKGEASLTNSTVQVLNSAKNGAGIYNKASLSLNLSSIGGDTPSKGNDASKDGGGLYNAQGGTVTLLGQADVTNNNAARGGGIFNVGTAILQAKSSVSRNTAGNGNGGGIYNDRDGTLNLDGQLGAVNVSRNTAQFSGGGLNNLGSARLADSEISDNVAVRTVGGGIANRNDLRLVSSLVTGNTSDKDGGGIFNARTGSGTLKNSTVTRNTATTGAGGGVKNDNPSNTPNNKFDASNATIVRNVAVKGRDISNDPGPVTIKNTILGDCDGPLTSMGYNLIQNISQCIINGDTSTNIIGLNPGLGPLQDNGGPNFTLAPLPGSPAIGAIPAGFCTDTTGQPVIDDQRGLRRPDGNPPDGLCDIGAVEVQSSPTGPKIVVYAGYADTFRGTSPNFPTPWQGSPNVTFQGSSTGSRGAYDAGAVRVVNTGTTNTTINGIRVSIGPCTVNIWAPATIAPGAELIVTQLNSNFVSGCPTNGSFDSSDLPPGVSCSPNGLVPEVAVTADGIQFTFRDTGQVLNTGGIDKGVCTPGGNESTRWTTIGSVR